MSPRRWPAPKPRMRFCRRCDEQLSRNQKDLPFTLTYFFERVERARLGILERHSRDHPLAPERIEPDADFPWPAHQIVSPSGASR